jgi:hypothetical protein
MKDSMPPFHEFPQEDVLCTVISQPTYTDEDQDSMPEFHGFTEEDVILQSPYTDEDQESMPAFHGNTEEGVPHETDEDQFTNSEVVLAEFMVPVHSSNETPFARAEELILKLNQL